jgi:hypothetical protein
MSNKLEYVTIKLPKIVSDELVDPYVNSGDA